MFQYVLKLADVAGRVAFVPPTDPGARENIKRELGKCRDKNNGYVLVTLQPPKRPRTTGEHSQNHHLNGHIMQPGCGGKNAARKYCLSYWKCPGQCTPHPQGRQ